MRILLLLFTIFSCLSNSAHAAPADCAPSAQEQATYVKKLFDQGLVKLHPDMNLASCRPEGYRCKNSLECCGFCNDGVCGSGGGGGSSCRPDGAVCKNSLECCGFCRDGECGNQSGGSQCRGAGLNCKNSLECCNFCRDGVCD